MTDRLQTRPAAVLLLAAMATSAVALPARADRDEWAPALTAQILDQHQCVVAFLSQVVERDVDGVEIVIAKAHCEDGRAFDVSREGILRAFEITECEVPDQETC